MEGGLPFCNALHPRLSALHPRLSALHLRLSALHLRLNALHPRLSAPHPRLSAPHPRLSALHPRLSALHFRLSALHPLFIAVYPPLLLQVNRFWPDSLGHLGFVSGLKGVSGLSRSCSAVGSDQLRTTICTRRNQPGVSSSHFQSAPPSINMTSRRQLQPVSTAVLFLTGWSYPPLTALL